jgi:hypothetical protein
MNAPVACERLPWRCFDSSSLVVEVDGVVRVALVVVVDDLHLVVLVADGNAALGVDLVDDEVVAVLRGLRLGREAAGQRIVAPSLIVPSNFCVDLVAACATAAATAATSAAAMTARVTPCRMPLLIRLPFRTVLFPSARRSLPWKQGSC